MKIGKQVQILVGLARLGAASFALADTATDTVVVVSNSSEVWDCNEATPERARWLADKATQDGAYQRAGECYVVAGEQHLANESFVKASAQTSTQTRRKLAANLNDVKAQARQMKEAFQHR
ncbi:MAG: hypothetical protein JO042_10825 [Sinobacteraceae bacterium]|nr:hypothetical protein [Nevskiaceae bacterium]